MTPRTPTIPTVVITPSTPSFTHDRDYGHFATFSEKLGSGSRGGSRRSSQSRSSSPHRSPRASSPMAFFRPTLPSTSRSNPSYSYTSEPKLITSDSFSAPDSSSSPLILGPPLPLTPRSSSLDHSPIEIDTNLLLPYSYSPQPQPSRITRRRKGAGILMSLSVITLFILVVVGPAVPISVLSESAGVSALDWMTGSQGDKVYTPVDAADMDSEGGNWVAEGQVDAVDAVDMGSLALPEFDAEADHALEALETDERASTEASSLMEKRQIEAQTPDDLAASPRPLRPSFGPGQGRRSTDDSASRHPSYGPGQGRRSFAFNNEEGSYRPSFGPGQGRRSLSIPDTAEENIITVEAQFKVGEYIIDDSSLEDNTELALIAREYAGHSLKDAIAAKNDELPLQNLGDGLAGVAGQPYPIGTPSTGSLVDPISALHQAIPLAHALPSQRPLEVEINDKIDEVGQSTSTFHLRAPAIAAAAAARRMGRHARSWALGMMRGP